MVEIRRSLDPFLLISQPSLLDFSFSPVYWRRRRRK